MRHVRRLAKRHKNGLLIIASGALQGAGRFAKNGLSFLPYCLKAIDDVLGRLARRPERTCEML